jgi:hypothetical protein
MEPSELLDRLSVDHEAGRSEIRCLQIEWPGYRDPDDVDLVDG